MRASSRAARRHTRLLIYTVSRHTNSFQATSSLTNPDDDAYRTVVDNAGFSHTPIDVIALARVIDRLVAFVAMAETALARGFSTTVVVRHDIVLIVGRVEAGAYPGNRRHLRTWWTGMGSASAATGNKSVDGTIAPVVAIVDITLGSAGVGFAAGAWL